MVISNGIFAMFDYSDFQFGAEIIAGQVPTGETSAVDPRFDANDIEPARTGDGVNGGIFVCFSTVSMIFCCFGAYRGSI